MIDYDKLNEHMLEIAKNTDGGIKLSAFMIDQLLGGCQKISEKSLHEGIEFAIAKQKREIEQERAQKTKKAKNTENEITNLLSFKKRQAYA